MELKAELGSSVVMTHAEELYLMGQIKGLLNANIRTDIQQIIQDAIMN